MLDIPPRLRLVLAVAAAGGFIFIIMGSLAGGGGGNIGLDKLVHGTGYALLGLLVVMALPPKWYLPAIVGIILAGIGLEFAQATVVKGRSFEMADALANAKGLIAGGCIGFLGRLIWAFVRSEIETLDARKRLHHYEAGAVVFKEGDPSDYVYVVRAGKVTVTREQTDHSSKIATLGEGDVFGEMGMVSDTPRSATVVTEGEVVLYRMEAGELNDTIEGREHPALPIARVLATRLRESNEKIQAIRTTISPAPDV